MSEPLVQPAARPTVKQRAWAYLTLLRPANVVTALADILAGFAVAGVGLDLLAPAVRADLAWLLLATAGLYGGGVVLNDVFDADLDAAERPERPIPSGRASRRGAAVFGGVLLLLGIGAAALASGVSAGLAVGIAVLVVVYDAAGKHHALLGPLNMGLCRGGNLLLGVSAVPAALAVWWPLSVIPLLYIVAITAVSRGEVHGGHSGIGWLAVGLMGFVVGALVGLGVLPGYHVLVASPFVVLLAVRVLPPFWQAARTAAPGDIRKAVRAGVLSLIMLDGALAAGFGGWLFGLLVLALWPLSALLARAFAVT